MFLAKDMLKMKRKLSSLASSSNGSQFVLAQSSALCPGWRALRPTSSITKTYKDAPNTCILICLACIPSSNSSPLSIVGTSVGWSTRYGPLSNSLQLPTPSTSFILNVQIRYISAFITRRSLHSPLVFIALSNSFNPANSSGSKSVRRCPPPSPYRFALLLLAFLPSSRAPHLGT